MLHLAITGYSACPLVPLALVVAATHPPVWLANLIELTALVWAAGAAYLSYSLVCRSSGGGSSASNGSGGGSGGALSSRQRVPLLAPPTLLMLMYWLSILPVRD